jgi:hypothetical protein
MSVSRRVLLLIAVLAGCGSEEIGEPYDDAAGQGASGSLAELCVGVTRPDGREIPRRGLANPTLERWRKGKGRAVAGPEKYGEVTSYGGCRVVVGETSHFGGPGDRYTHGETGAVSGEVLQDIQERFYVAMRWNYEDTPREFLHPRSRDHRRFGARFLVLTRTPGGTLRGVVVRPVDWGPDENLARVIDLSPAAYEHLGVDDVAGQVAGITFAPEGTPVGPVSL